MHTFNFAKGLQFEVHTCGSAACIREALHLLSQPDMMVTRNHFHHFHHFHHLAVQPRYQSPRHLGAARPHHFRHCSRHRCRVPALVSLPSRRTTEDHSVSILHCLPTLTACLSWQQVTNSGQHIHPSNLSEPTGHRGKNANFLANLGSWHCKVIF